jgi:hypothetical protein
MIIKNSSFGYRITLIQCRKTKTHFVVFSAFRIHITVIMTEEMLSVENFNRLVGNIDKLKIDCSYRKD